MRILEGPYYTRKPKNDEKYRFFDSFFNSIWLVVITITTVGYGDVFAMTVPGRVLTMCIAISSLFIIA